MSYQKALEWAKEFEGCSVEPGESDLCAALLQAEELLKEAEELCTSIIECQDLETTWMVGKALSTGWLAKRKSMVEGD